MMQGIASWLNSNSGAVTAAATAIYAVATIFIAWFTYVTSRTLKWEKEKDRRSRQPVLIFIDEITDDHRSLYVKNVGYGPAMDVVRNIIQPGNRLQTTSNEPLQIGCLGPGEKVYAYCATAQPGSSVPIIDDPKFQAALEYDDVLGNHYEIGYQERHHSTPAVIAQRKMSWNQVERV